MAVRLGSRSAEARGRSSAEQVGGRKCVAVRLRSRSAEERPWSSVRGAGPQRNARGLLSAEQVRRGTPVVFCPRSRSAEERPWSSPFIRRSRSAEERPWSSVGGAGPQRNARGLLSAEQVRRGTPVVFCPRSRSAEERPWSSVCGAGRGTNARRLLFSRAGPQRNARGLLSAEQVVGRMPVVFCLRSRSSGECPWSSVCGARRGTIRSRRCSEAPAQRPAARPDAHGRHEPRLAAVGHLLRAHDQQREAGGHRRDAERDADDPGGLQP